MLVAVLAGVSLVCPQDCRAGAPIEKIKAEKKEPLPAGALIRLGGGRFRHGFGLARVALLSGGKVLISGGLDGSLHFWDANSGAERRQINPPMRSYTGRFGMALSPDGRIAATAGSHLRLIDLVTGKTLAAPPYVYVEAGPVFAPDGKSFYVSSNGLVRIFEVATTAAGKDKSSFRVHPIIHALALSADGKRLATGGFDQTVRVWDPTNGLNLLVCKGHKGRVFALDFSPDGKTLASGGGDSAVIVWDVQTGKERSRFVEQQQGITSVVYSPDGHFLAATGNAGPIHLWHVPSGKLVRRCQGHVGAVQSAVFSADGKILYSAGTDGTIRMWETRLAEVKGDPKGWKAELVQELLPHQGHVGGIRQIAFSSDSQTVLTYGGDRTVRRWDQVTGKELSVCPLPSARHLAFNPDGRTMILACPDATLRLCDVATGKELRHSRFPEPLPDYLAFSPGGKILAVASAFDYRLSLFDAVTLKERRRWSAHHDGSTGLAFADGGRILVSSSHDTTTRVWNVADGEEIQEFNLSSNVVSPDGRFLVAGGPNGEYDLFDTRTAQRRGKFKSRPGYARLVFSADGWYLALVTGETLIVHETMSGQEVANFQLGQVFTNSLVFAPDCRTLASGGDAGNVLLWDVTGIRKGPKLPVRALAPGELDQLWTAMGGSDASAANRALWSLVAARPQVIPFLTKKLLAQPSLQDIKGLAQTPDALRSMRAIRVLELIGKAEDQDKRLSEAATELLTNLTKGKPGSLQSSAAQAARTRLGKPADVEVTGLPAVKPPQAKKAPLAQMFLRLGQTQFEANQQVSCVTFSPDGKTLALAVNGNSVRLWDALTGKELRRWPAPMHHASGLAFSPDGKILVGGGLDKAVHRWDLNTGKELAPLKGHAESVSGVAFARDGHMYASGSGDSIRLWHAKTGKELRHWSGHGKGSTALAFSPDGKMLASSGSDGKVCLWDTRTGERKQQVAGACDSRWLAFTPDGKRLAALGPARNLIMWDLATGAEAEGFQRQRLPVHAFGFSADGTMLAVGLATGELNVLKAQTGEFLLQLQRMGRVGVQQRFTPGGKEQLTVMGRTDVVTTLAFSPDGKQVAAAATDHSLRVWDIQTKKLLIPSEGERSAVQALAFTPDGKNLVAIGTDHHVHMWNHREGKKLRQRAFQSFESRGLALSADGRIYSVNDRLGWVVHLRSTAEGPDQQRIISLRDMPTNLDSAMAMGLSSNGKVLATAGFQQVRLWDTGTGKLLQTFTDIPRGIYPWAITFSADDRFIAIANTTNPPCLFDRTTGQRLPTLQGRGGGVDYSVFSADARSLYAVCSDRKIYHWEVATGRFRTPLLESPVPVTALALSPDGRTLVSAGSDHQLYIWDSATGEALGQLTGHLGDIKALAFSSDGGLLASGSKDGSIIIWKVAVRPRPAMIPKRVEDLKRLWDDLAAASGQRAFRAILALSLCDQSPAFLAKHLSPTKGPNARHVADLVAQLDSKQFQVRERASAELAKLTDAVRPLLRKMMEDKVSPEVRQRLQRLLAKPATPVSVSPQSLGQLRAVEALELLGTSGARQLLERLAEGAAGDPLTEGAQGACGRLKTRKLPE